MKMTREKKILLSLILCGCFANTAHATSYDLVKDNPSDTDVYVNLETAVSITDPNDHSNNPSQDGNTYTNTGGIWGGDSVTIGEGQTLTITTSSGVLGAEEYAPVAVSARNKGDSNADIIIGSDDAIGVGTLVLKNDTETGSGAYYGITRQYARIEDGEELGTGCINIYTDLVIDGYTYGIAQGSNDDIATNEEHYYNTGLITIHNKNTTIENCDTGIFISDGATVHITGEDSIKIDGATRGIDLNSTSNETVVILTGNDIEFTNIKGYGVYAVHNALGAEKDGMVYINGTTGNFADSSAESKVLFSGSSEASGNTVGIYTNGTSGTTNTAVVAVGADNITFENLTYGLESNQYSDSTTVLAGTYSFTEADNKVTTTSGKSITFNNCDFGIYDAGGNNASRVYVDADKVAFNMSGNTSDNHYAVYSAGSDTVNINGNEEVTVRDVKYGIYSSASGTVNITSGKDDGTGGTVTFENVYEGIRTGSSSTSSITVTNTGKGGTVNIYSTYIGLDMRNSSRVEITSENVNFGGEGTDGIVYNNSYSDIYTASGSSATINSSGEVNFNSGNPSEGNIYANGGTVTIGALNGTNPDITFNLGEDSWAGIYARGASSNVDITGNSVTFTGGGQAVYAGDAGAAKVNITADKAVFSGQTGDYATLKADAGATITVNAKEIDMSRADDTYLAEAWDEEGSTINIKADTGTITGSFMADGLYQESGTNSDGVPTVTLNPEGAGVIDLDLGTSTEWNITADSAVTNLTLGNASTLTFSYAGSGGAAPFINLYTDSLASGSGSTINMNINASALNESDHIYINGEHTGTSVINLNANGSDLSDAVLGTILVSVNTESGGFTAGSGTKGTYEGALYNWKYTLAMADGTEESRKIEKTGKLMDMDNYTNDWYLTDVEIVTEEEPEPGDGGPGPAQPNPGDGGTPTTTTTVEAIKAANAVNYYAFRETDKLLRRMGELRNNGEDEQGVWIRVKGAKTGRNGSFENKYVHYEGGYDHLVKNDHREKRYEGFSLSHTEGDVKYKEVTGSGKAHDEEIAFYRVDQYKHGHYLDLVTRIGIYNNRFGVYDTNQNKISGKNHNYGVSTSAEYGRKKDYAHDWYVEPQGQATLGYLSGNEYITSNNVNVSNGSISSAVGRIGVNIGKGFTDKKGRRGKFYAKANWLKEFLGSYGIDMTTENSRRHAHGNYKDTWFEWGFGVTYQYTKNNFFYADVEKTHGSAYYKNWAWNVGLRWTFN